MSLSTLIYQELVRYHRGEMERQLTVDSITAILVVEAGWGNAAKQAGEIIVRISEMMQGGVPA